MAKLFVDTWGWLTLHDKSEARHQEVVAFYRSFRNQNGLIYTTDYVLYQFYVKSHRFECLKSLQGKENFYAAS